MQKKRLSTLKGFIQAIKGEQPSDSDSDTLDSEDHVTEDEEKENLNFTWVKSQFSFNLKDVESIIVGGMSSKFW